MSVRADFEIAIDLNGDRDFSDTNEDVSSYVEYATWQLGLVDDRDFVARTATAQVVLRNRDGRFSPEHAVSIGLKPGALLRIQSTYNSTTQHFIGWIDNDGIQPAPGYARETVIRASSWLVRLLDVEIALAVQEGKTYDEILAAIITASGVYPPGTVGWLLGVTGFSELGVTTVLGSGTVDYIDAEAGSLVYAYAGDNWRDGTSVRRALGDLMATEGGLLYVGRDGIVHARAGDWQWTDVTNAVDVTLDDEADIIALDYEYGRVVNHAVVTCNPRTVGSSNETLGTLTYALSVPANGSETITVRFDDGSGNHIGGKSVITPVASTDWSANAASDGGGADLTSSISISMEAFGDKAELTIANSSGTDAYILNAASSGPGLTVRGIKITDFGQVAREATSEDSIVEYGEQRRELRLIMLDDPEQARNRAAREVALHANPSGAATRVRIHANKSAALMTAALELSIEAKVALSEAWTGLGGDYHIIGERFELTNLAEGGDLYTDWYLTPSPTANPIWLLGVTGFSELGVSTILG